MYTCEAYSTFELRKESLNPVARSPGTLVGWCACQFPNRLPRCLVPVYRNLARGTGGAPSLLPTTSALLRGRAVIVCPLGSLQTAIRQSLAFGTVINVRGRIIAEVVARETPIGLMAVIDNRNMWLDALRQ